MKRKVVVGLAALMVAGMAISLAPSVSAKKKLTWWMAPDDTWREIVKRFEKQHPGVEVQFMVGGIDKFYTMITAGLMPDVWGPWDTPGIQADVNRNWVIDLTPYIERDGKSMNIDDFFPGLMREFRIAGKQFSLPIFDFVDYYFYNKQLYAQAGLTPPPIDSSDKSWNWDKMVQNSLKLTVRDPISGKPKVAGINFSVGTFNFPNYFHLWGAEPYSKETLKTAVPQAVHYNTPEMINCLTKMWELKWRYNVYGGSFISNFCGATMEHGYNIQNFMLVKNLQFALAPLPWAKTNSGTLWPDGWRISRQCKDKELAWQFIKFLCSPESMRFIVSDPKSHHRGSPMARKSVFRETLGRDIGAKTGMSESDVFKVTAQADEVGIVKYQETVCLHADLAKYVDPELDNLWANKFEPKVVAQRIQKAADQGLPRLFNHWLKSVKFTSADKWYEK